MTLDPTAIGTRIAQARARAGLTQDQLAAAVTLDRSALAKVESGRRRLSALELVQLAEALGQRIEWFVQEAPPTIASHRNTTDPGAPSPRIDDLAERITREVEFVRTHTDRLRLSVSPEHPMPGNVREAEALGATARRLLGLDEASPCHQLADKLATCGLLTFSFELGDDTADAATVLLREGGIALINGSRQVGRRRLAAGHEFGHYLVADDYTVDWRVAEHKDDGHRESLLDRFARALLLPEEGLRAIWAQHGKDLRTAAVRAGSTFRVDMATLARRAMELDLITHEQARTVRGVRTTRADIVELDLVVHEELEPPALPRAYELAVLHLYRNESVSTDRALDLLLDTWDEDALPELPRRAEDQLWQYV